MAASNSAFSATHSDAQSGVKLGSGDQPGLPVNVTIWENLKLAISESSGFKRWKVERQPDQAVGVAASLDQSLDELVHRYLRDTLETLAY
jgi:hypothetical protein